MALVGENGSGKSTLAKLIAGPYEPDDETVTWNGDDLRTLAASGVRGRIAITLQDFDRWGLTAWDNVAFGRPDVEATPAEVETAARLADIHDVIEHLPDGYTTRLSTQISDGAIELSGGRWQRLALARTVDRGGELLILDERLASLDPLAERDLLRRLADYSTHRAVLFISHRFSTVHSADRIYVMDSGQVAEAGAHDELMALDGLYAEMFRAQAAPFTD